MKTKFGAILIALILLIALVGIALAQQGAEIRVTHSASRADQPDVVIDSNGNVHIVYTDEYGTSYRELWYTMLDSAGATLIDDTRITDDDGVDSTRPAIVLDSTNKAHIFWRDERWDGGSYKEVTYTKLDPYLDDMSGDPAISSTITLIDDTRMSNNEEWYMYGIRAAVDSNDDIHIVWDNDDNDNIYYKKIDADGNELVPETVIRNAGQWRALPDLALDSNDNLHLAWADYGNTSSDEVYYMMLDNVGNILIDATLLTPDDDEYSKWTAIVVDYADDVHIVWQDDSGSNKEIWYTKIDPSLDDQNGDPADGDAITLIADTPLTPDDGVKSRHPAVATSCGNTIHVTWEEDDDDNIHYMVLDSEGNTVIGITPLTTNGTAYPSTYWSLPYVDADPYGTAHVVWPDSRDGNYEVYYTSYATGRVCVFGQMDGHVYDAATMNPIEGVTIKAGAGTQTDASGYYTMTTSIGVYTATATHPWYTTVYSPGVEILTDTLTTVDWYLTARGRLYGTVTDYDSGAPLEATIVISGYGSTTSDPASGYYEIYVDAGTYDLEALAPGYVTGTATVDIISGQDTPQDFSLAYAVAFAPRSLHVTLDWQTTASTPATLTNRLPTDYAFAFFETDEGFMPLAICHEYYGGDLGSSGSGNTRDRGNFFEATENTTINEIYAYLNFASATDMYYIVYEAGSLVDTYTQIFTLQVMDVGPGEQWYSSGPIAVPVKAGKFYYVGASWNAWASYYRNSNNPTPYATQCFGILHTGNAGASAGYPPGPSFDNTSASGANADYGFGIVTGGDRVPWLGEQPISGTIPADSTLAVTILFSATYAAGVDQPGDYYAELMVVGDPDLAVPITMTVLPPADMGKVEGYVLDRCLGEPVEATIHITGGIPITETTTYPDGYYAAWLVPGTYELAFTADGYLTHTTSVDIVAGMTTTLDVDLFPDRACISVEPQDGFEVWLVTGTQVYTHSTGVDLTNDGGQPLDYEFIEVDRGYLTPTLGVRGTMPEVPLPGGVSSSDDFRASPTEPSQILGTGVLLIQDTPAWGYDAWTAILTANGIPFDTINSSQIPATDFSQYEMIAIPSVQGSTYNLTFNNNLSKFETFIDIGGIVVMSFCTQFDHTPYIQPPFGGTNNYGSDNNNYIEDTAHPIMAGVPNPYTGSSASHNYMSDLLPDDRILVTQGTTLGGNTVMIERDHGAGMLVAGGQTFEYGWNAGWGNGIILENMIPHYYYNWFPTGDVPWMWEEPISGTVGSDYVPLAATHADIMFTAFYTDATPMPLGTYSATLVVINNDPVAGTPYLPAIMHIVEQYVTPTASFTSDSPTCLGTPTTFTNTTSGGVPPASIYLWGFGDGLTSTLENPSHVYGADGTYTVTLTACSPEPYDLCDSYQDVVEVLPLPAAGFDYGVDFYTVQFTNTSMYTYDYVWDLGDGATSTETHPVHTYATTGTYAVVLEATGDCGTDVFSDTVTIEHCEPVTGVTLSYTNTGTIYPGTLVYLQADIAPDDFTAPYNYVISYGDGAVVTDTGSLDPLALQHTYTATGTYDVEISVWNCAMTQPLSDTVQVVVSEPEGYRIYLPLILKNN